MEKNLSALGFMSGTSGDGVDSSVISSNGKDTINIKYNRFSCKNGYKLVKNKKTRRNLSKTGKVKFNKTKKSR